MKLQLVTWFPVWIGIRVWRPAGGLMEIYDWCILLGFWEIRKWRRR